MNYAEHYHRLVLRAKTRDRPGGYVEKHHVVPRCLGGTDESENLVILTAREHYVAHQLLVKMHPDHYGVCYAAKLMTTVGRGQGRANNRYYAWLKARFSKLQSLIMKEWNAEHGNVSRREDVKRKRREAWLGEKNPSYKNPNWAAIEAAAAATRGKTQSDEHKQKKSEAIKNWHLKNPDRHPMKNPETVAKAAASRRQTWLKKKGIT